jgi:hypothetical protein
LLAPSGHRDDLTMDDDSIADASLLDASDSSAVDAADSDGKAPSKRQATTPTAINPFDGPSASADSLVALDLGDEGGPEIVADLVNAVDTGEVPDRRPSLSASAGYSDAGGFFGGFGGFFGGAVGGGGVPPLSYVARRSSGIAGQRGNVSSEATEDDSPAEETGSSNAGGNGNGHGGNVTPALPDSKNAKGPVSMHPTDESGGSILEDPEAHDPGKPGASGDAPTTPPVANPEPASLVLLGSGLALTAHSLRQRRRNR